MTRTAEDSPKLIELRWRALREELSAAGAARETVAALGRLVRDHDERRDSGALAAFATDADVVVSDLRDEPVTAECARFGPLPHVMPMLASRGEPLPHLVVVADRLGAEIVDRGTGDAPRTTSVRPDIEAPFRKPHGGDLNQSRYQRAAEDHWRANARAVARAVDARATGQGRAVVVLAGDPQARGAVLEELSEPVLARTVEARHAEGPPLAEEVEEAVALASTERLTDHVERFHRELAHGRRAVAGLDAVTEALRKAQVATLLIEDHPESTDRLWFGPAPTDLATSADQLRDLNVSEPVEDRADAVLVRALVETGANLVVVPHGSLHAEHGIGALLRFADA